MVRFAFAHFCQSPIPWSDELGKAVGEKCNFDELQVVEFTNWQPSHAKAFSLFELETRVNELQKAKQFVKLVQSIIHHASSYVYCINN